MLFTHFTPKYSICTAANPQRTLANSTIEGVSYSVYNVFLSGWLKNQ